ncbi:Gfo/Idh/MocA family protein [Paenibacillus planticolens]|uniref:Gfo/Idh/MocA family oxidoreductase n=1 Tax=Paenibacillus planticolens TaxID=2654976 RepID=A0ABX1ZQ25_9BACL|nr:Gfo/Idh/MocA family oxidoreductase [Paenibacillus planticolens]NOV01916.1 hypothetical protein [Paenibacillus planticolens]
MENLSMQLSSSNLLAQRNLRVGLIGIGPHSEENLIPAIAVTEDISLIAVASRTPEKLERIKKIFPVVHGYSNWRDMLDPQIIDAVVISAPPDLHYEVAKVALELGIHIFIEKPPAPDLKTLLDLVDRVKKCPGIVCNVGYNFRTSGALKKAIALFKENDDSHKIVGCKIRFLSSKPRTVMWNNTSVLESFLYAVGIHALDFVVNLFGEPVKINAEILNLDNGQKFSLIVTINFASGFHTTLEMGNYSNKFDSRFEFLSSDGKVCIVDNLSKISFLDENISKVSPFNGKENLVYDYSGLNGGYERTGYSGEISVFRDMILGRLKPSCGISESVAVYKIIDEILRKTKEK